MNPPQTQHTRTYQYYNNNNNNNNNRNNNHNINHNNHNNHNHNLFPPIFLYPFYPFSQAAVRSLWFLQLLHAEPLRCHRWTSPQMRWVWIVSTPPPRFLVKKHTPIKEGENRMTMMVLFSVCWFWGWCFRQITPTSLSFLGIIHLWQTVLWNRWRRNPKRIPVLKVKKMPEVQVSKQHKQLFLTFLGGIRVLVSTSSFLFVRPTGSRNKGNNGGDWSVPYRKPSEKPERWNAEISRRVRLRIRSSRLNRWG